jgi:uncharacterized protein DUF6178
MLHRVIQSCGLEDSGALVALATSAQLTAIFDVDLWRADRPGLDEQFDSARFAVWLEVLLESGTTVAAQKLANMDVDLVIAALAQHALVFDLAALSPATTTDGEELAMVRPGDDALSCDVGGYLVVARRTDAWNAIVAVLVALDADHHDCFHRVMNGCRSLSNSNPEIDGLDDLLTDSEQVMYDLASDRERRREKQGYVSAAQARAFLQMSRHGPDTTQRGGPVASAYFRALEWTAPADVNNTSRGLIGSSGAPPAPDDSPDAVAAVVEVLLQAGVLPQQPRGLLDSPQGRAPRLARIQAHMQFVRDRDPAAHSSRSQEIAYLANTLMAGCPVQGRPFSAQEASDAAIAVCNLGLENWPPPRGLAGEARVGSSVIEAGTLPDAFLVGHDLVRVFQVGWTVLHEDVCMYAAERLVTVLTRLRCEDREIQRGLDELRVAMAKHCHAGAPWRACGALDVIAILDMPAWATLVGLIGECPVIHAGMAASLRSGARAIDASAFEFISEMSQIASVREFMQRLPEMLQG